MTGYRDPKDTYMDLKKLTTKTKKKCINMHNVCQRLMWYIASTQTSFSWTQTKKNQGHYEPKHNGNGTRKSRKKFTTKTEGLCPKYLSQEPLPSSALDWTTIDTLQDPSVCKMLSFCWQPLTCLPPNDWPPYTKMRGQRTHKCEHKPSMPSSKTIFIQSQINSTSITMLLFDDNSYHESLSHTQLYTYSI